MNTIKTLGYASLSSVVLAIATPMLSMAEGVSTSAVTHSSVHRVIHSLAETQVYTGGNVAGNKWENGVELNRNQIQWADSTPSRSGSKWGDSTVIQSHSPSFAGTSEYQWGLRSYSEQAGNKWALRNYAEQAGNKWALRNYAEQAGNKWALRNYAEQAGNKWALRNYAEQAGNKWALRNYVEQAGNKWALRNYAEQTGNKAIW